MKEYYIKHENFLRGYFTIWRGTLEHLINDVFGYTLDCGNSWDNKINKNPKTGKSLVNNLNRSASATRRYNDYYELLTREQYNEYNEKEDFSQSKTIYKR